MSAAWSTRGSAAEDARVVILAAAGRRRQGNGANRSTKWSFDGSRTLSVPAWMTRSMVWGLIVGMSTLARRAARTSLFGGVLENQAWPVEIRFQTCICFIKKVKHPDTSIYWGARCISMFGVGLRAAAQPQIAASPSSMLIELLGNVSMVLSRAKALSGGQPHRW